ncbi:MAG: hypothetical protein AAF747_08460, partial [Planctomycetota bacterium]
MASATSVSLCAVGKQEQRQSLLAVAMLLRAERRAADPCSYLFPFAEHARDPDRNANVGADDRTG